MKTKNIIIISVAASLFVISTTVSCVLFLPRRLSGLIDINHATSIRYHDMNDGTFVLSNERYQDFYEATKQIHYTIEYMDCLCRTDYDLLIEYPFTKVTTINGYYYYSEMSGVNVGEAKSITFSKGTIEDLRPFFEGA